MQQFKVLIFIQIATATFLTEKYRTSHTWKKGKQIGEMLCDNLQQHSFLCFKDEQVWGRFSQLWESIRIRPKQHYGAVQTSYGMESIERLWQCSEKLRKRKGKEASIEENSGVRRELKQFKKQKN